MPCEGSSDRDGQELDDRRVLPPVLLQASNEQSQVRDEYLEASKNSVQRLSKYYAHNDRALTLIRHAKCEIHQAELLDLLKEQQKLRDGLQSLLATFSTPQAGQAEKQDVEATVTSMEHTSRYLETFIVNTLGWNPTATLPSEQSAKSAKAVFDIPELTVTIMSHLQPMDLLKAASANKSMAGALQDSTELQSILCIHRFHPKSDNSHWFAPYRSFHSQSGVGRLPGIKCHEFNHQNDPNDPIGLWVPLPSDSYFETIHFEAELEYGTKWIRENVGTRGLSMQLCQPAVTEMDVFPDCCSRFRPGHYYDGYHRVGEPDVERIHPVRSSSGLTVADLLAMAEKIEKEHRLCPYAAQNAHDPETGEVNVKVKFLGKVEIEYSNPVVVVDEMSTNKSQGQDYLHAFPFFPFDSDDLGEGDFESDDLIQRDSIKGYMIAKRQADMAGEPIPTLQEYRELLKADPDFGRRRRAYYWD